MKLRDFSEPTFDFHSQKNHLLLNPRLRPEAFRFFSDAWASVSPKINSHFGLATSGTSSKDAFGKLVLLSKAAILASAKSVNLHLSSDEKDIWLKALPDFHVGGLGILARAHLSGAQVIEVAEEKWSALKFYQSLETSKATLISLVPTQVFDLVRENLMAPNHVRAVLVGGAALSESLFTEAKRLGWNILTCYGMTETSSMVACSGLSSVEQQLPRLLSHANIKLDPAGRIEISSEGLFSGYVVKNHETFEIVDPKHYDENFRPWFLTEDIGVLSSLGLQIFGRGSDFFKVGGEGVSLLKLENILSQISLDLKVVQFDFSLLVVQDSRLGSRVDFICSARSLSEAEEIVKLFNLKVMGFEKIREIHIVNELPRTELGKLRREEALSLIDQARAVTSILT